MDALSCGLELHFGQVPNEVGSMPYISNLDLSSLRLSGTLSQALYHHTSLQTLNVAENPMLHISMHLFAATANTKSISITVSMTRC